MINLLFRLFLTFNATSLIIVVYLVKSQILINHFCVYIFNLPHFVSYAIYFAIPVLFTYLSLFLSTKLIDESIEIENGISAIKEIEQANNAYLPSYLGYFFVALSVPYCDTLIFVFVILFLFTFLSQTLYFNPLFLIFGYHFYYLTTATNIKIFLISRKELKDPRKINLPKLKRINDFTFIDQEN
ncbi:hypothetical protein FFWV33_10165 [Flavobacterium faecale]|uniref:Uncharacterized protein n=1 Tax=Flavobacterium faecale TaxID=1355330 RepID=A0A2S1LIQ7_9FLAO|nr:hypothetical protein FFWV33_10165 [Flavobacterium faecale]